MKNSVKAFALGGLDEIGKVCFVLEIAAQIFVFDCGIKQLKEIDLGINYVIPDFNYLVRHRQRIQGIFLSNASERLTGGLKFLLRSIPQLPIYASALTKVILSNKPEQNRQIINNLVTLDKTNQWFGNVQITSFAIAADLPGNVGYIIKHRQQKIVYTNSFLINNQKNQQLFSTDLAKVCCDRTPTLCLIGNAQQAQYASFAKPYNHMRFWLEKALDSGQQKVYITCFEDEWWQIHSTIQFLSQYKTRQFQVVFFDRAFGEWYRTNMRAKTAAANLFFDKKTPKQASEHQVIFITGNEKWLFNRINLLINNKTHPLALDAQSYFLLAIKRSGHLNEISLNDLLNRLHTTTAQIQFINEKNVLPMTGGAEDLKLLIKILAPQFFWPINGYHQDLKRSATSYQRLLQPDAVLIRENGEVVNWTTDNQLSSDYQAIGLDSVFVESNEQEYVGETTIQERKQLGENGIVLTAVYYQITDGQVSLISSVKTDFIGVGINSSKQEKVNGEIANLINNYLKKRKILQKLQKQEFEKYINKNILLILKKEINRTPIVEFTAIEKHK